MVSQTGEEFTPPSSPEWNAERALATLDIKQKYRKGDLTGDRVENFEFRISDCESISKGESDG